MDACRRVAALLAGLACAAPAAARPDAAPELEWPSCVEGSPPLRLPAATERAALDAADRERFERAARARYALYQRGGVTPTQVLLLRRGRHWQYLTLWPGGPAGPCFSAVFAAERFDFTPGWIAKYRPRAEPLDD